jgi:hypothetical protein
MTSITLEAPAGAVGTLGSPGVLVLSLSTTLISSPRVTGSIELKAVDCKNAIPLSVEGEIKKSVLAVVTVPINTPSGDMSSRKG